MTNVLKESIKAIGVFIGAFILSSCACKACFPAEPVKLVYPTKAAEQTELDASTPLKRITPPTTESSELDPVTPIGQVRAILESLTNIQDQQQAFKVDLDALKATKQVDLTGLATKTDLKDIVFQPVRNKLLDVLNICTFALVLLQVVILCGSTILNYVKNKRTALEEEIAKRYLEKHNGTSGDSNKSIF